MSREFGRCRGCGEEIEWALLNGKPHPFDVIPTDKDRGYELVELSSEPRTVAVYVSSAARQSQKTKPRLVVSHFATCPAAAKFRSKTG